MKKLCLAVLVGVLTMSLMACGNTTTEEPTETTEVVTVNVKNGSEEMVDIEVPLSPKKIVFLDYVAFDLCAALGILDDPEVEFLVSQDSLPAHLTSYVPEGSPSLGGLKEYDMEAIMSFQPDIIFSSGRTAAMYDEFSMIAPTVCSSLEYLPSTYESFKSITLRNASIFGMEAEAEEIMSGYDARVEALTAWTGDQTAMTGIFTGGVMSTLGNESRGSMIYNDLGFTNMAADVDTTHGNESSYEVMLKQNPDFFFVMDRDSAISAEGASTAEELLENDIVKETSTYQNRNIVYLNPDVWYLCEGGVLAMDIMLADLEVGMNK